MTFSKESLRFYALTRAILGKSALKIHSELLQVWSDATPCLRTVQRWIKDFNDGSRTSLEDRLHCVRPKSSRTAALIDSVTQIAQDDPRLSSRDIASEVDSNHTTILRILNFER